MRIGRQILTHLRDSTGPVVIIFTVALLGITGCDSLVPTLTEPPGNSRDPDSLNPGPFIPPATFLNSPIASGETITTDTIALWIKGNRENMLFRYRWDSTDESDWSEWTAEHSDRLLVSREYLDE